MEKIEYDEEIVEIEKIDRENAIDEFKEKFQDPVPDKIILKDNRAFNLRSKSANEVNAKAR